MARCWIVERALCFCRGHRDLSLTASYGGVLPDGHVRDLHFCRACDSPVWVKRQLTSAERNPEWEIWETNLNS